MARKALLCALLLVLVSTTTGVAQAAPSSGVATNYRTDFIDATPPADAPTAWVVRDIYLAAGTYHWELNRRTADTGLYKYPERRDIYLAAGWYRWECWLDPFVSPSYHQYQMGCSLEHPGGIAFLISSLHLWPYGDNWTWGGKLTG